MPIRRRIGALALGAVAFALTVTGVVIAATDSNPAGVARDPLTLNGYPPRSAALALTLSNGSSLTVSATVDVNFTTNRIDAIARFPVLTTSAAIEARLVSHELYVRSANVSSGPWFSLKVATPSLFGYALELTKPDLYLLSGFSKSTSTSGYSRTSVFTRHDVAVGSPLKASATSSLGTIRWSITTGSQGEVTSSSLRVTSKKRVTTVNVTVLSYNNVVHVAQPAATNVRPIAASEVSRLLRSQSFASFLLPRNLLSLPVTHLS